MGGYGRIKEHERNLLPAYICLAVNETCFMRCKMCHKWAAAEPCGKVPLDVWKKFIDDVCRLSGHRPEINFAGGEPLLCPDLWDLLSYASAQGCFARLATNGYLIGRETAQALCRCGVGELFVSLDASRETHDFLRGTPGAYDRAVRAIDLLAETGGAFSVNICTVICAVNIAEISALVQWTAGNANVRGIGFQAVTQPFNTPIEDCWHRDPRYAFLWPSDPDQADEVMDRLIALKRRGADNGRNVVLNSPRQFEIYKRYFRDPGNFIKQDECHVYRRALNITPEGEVHFCFYQPALGNIRRQGIQEILSSPKAQEVRRMIRQCRKNCQSLVNCNFDEKEAYV